MGITTKDLAQICGVSRTTVHRALANTGRINPQTKELILKVAQEHDYRPDLLARGLVKGQTYYIGVVLLDVNNRYFSQMLSAIEVEARKQGYFVNITLHENSKEMEKEQLNRLTDYHVDGIILSSVNKGEEYKKFLENLDTPIVSINNKIADGIPFVGINERQATMDATEKIVQSGYEKIVFVCPPLADKNKENVYVHEERASAFEQVMKQFPNKEKVVIGNWKYLDLSYKELIKSAKRTAFFCSGDLFALELMKFMNSKGKITPKDYGIMGFDNIDTLQYVNPKLSTIYNSVEEVAKTSVNLLFDLINGMEVEKEKILGYVAIDGETL
jgi:LacI family transcriptional regulator